MLSDPSVCLSSLGLGVCARVCVCLGCEVFLRSLALVDCSEACEVPYL